MSGREEIIERVDLGYVTRGELVRCKDCKNRESYACPMFFEEWFTIDEGDGCVDDDYRVYDYTVSDGYCHRGERREDGEA